MHVCGQFYSTSSVNRKEHILRNTLIMINLQPSNVQEVGSWVVTLLSGGGGRKIASSEAGLTYVVHLGLQAEGRSRETDIAS